MTVFSILFLLALTTQTPSPEPPISAITVTYDKFDDIHTDQTRPGRIHRRPRHFRRLDAHLSQWQSQTGRIR